MYRDDKQIIIGRKSFDSDVFEYLLNRFKEAFSHSSLTIESAFKELEDLDFIIKQQKDDMSNQFYQLLSANEKREISDIVKQIIVFKASYLGTFSEKLDNSQKQVNRLYGDNLTYFDSYWPYYIKFDSEGNFDKIASFHSLDALVYNLPAYNQAYSKAYNMQKDNLDSFDYAMGLSEITVPEIIKINSIVIRSDPDKVDGFKKTNNNITTASFTPTDKSKVPYEMQRLLAEYKNGFGEELLDPNEQGITSDERMERVYKLFKREALFHIRFERIHPFNDGNGRTGRIIMNYNLLNQGLAPVIITGVMSREYKQYINNFDVDGLAQMLANSSSQQMATWVSLTKAGISVKKSQISPDNSKLAEIYGYKPEDGKKTLAKIRGLMMLF